MPAPGTVRATVTLARLEAFTVFFSSMVASGLTLPEALCRTASVADWKQRPAPAGGRPAVFAIGP